MYIKNTKSAPNNAAPSKATNTPSKETKKNKSTEANIIIGQSVLKKLWVTFMSDNITVTPNTKARFAILDPITFPKAKSECPWIADFKLTINSGAEVAKDTTVIPITILEMRSLKEKPTAAFNNQSPPTINNVSPMSIFITSI